jgi:hypothetical protein
MSACLWKKTALPVRAKLARNESVNHLYNVRLMCIVPVLFALRVIMCNVPVLFALRVIIYLLTPWSKVLPEKLTGFQLVKKFSAFYGTRRFITAVRSVRHLSLSWASSITPKYQSRCEAYPLTVSQHDTFLWWGVVSTSPNSQAVGPPLVGCPRLLIQYIRSYPPYWRPFLHPQPEDTPCCGDRDPLNTSVNAKQSHVLTCCAKCVYEFYSHSGKK